MQLCYSNLQQAIIYSLHCLKNYGVQVNTEKWQGLKDAPPMLEFMNLHWQAMMPSGKQELIRFTKADMPWAEDHFLERVSGKPLNPGEQYKNWPGYKNVKFNDSHFRNEGEKFSHTYMERYWPKFAGVYEPDQEGNSGKFYGGDPRPDDINRGIRYAYGDLQDVIDLLKKEPFTRQAYLPIWGFEDTGVLHGGRVPCSIGYHFMRRGNQLHVQYFLRSCDALRHFRNDIYLTTRLVQWIINEIQTVHDLSGTWKNVVPGIFTMNIASFHVFEKEKNLIL